MPTEDLTGEVGADDSPRGDAVLDALGDDCSRRILVATSACPMSAKELTERCVLSPTTVYRRINALADRNLLEERVSIGSDGRQTTVYEPTFGRAELCLTPEGVRVETFDDADDATLLSGLVSRTDDAEIDLQVEDGEITVSIPPTDDLLRALGRALRNE